MIGTFKLSDLGAPMDERGFAEGFSVGKAAAIQEWRFRKEQDAHGFRGLCRRLQQQRYRDNLDPERKERAKLRRAEWARIHKDTMRQKAAARLRRVRKSPAYREAQYARDRASYRARRAAYWASVAYTCELCGKVWRPAPDSRPSGRQPRYCSRSHRERHARIKAKAKECHP